MYKRVEILVDFYFTLLYNIIANKKLIGILNMDKWMMLELETIYGQKRYAIYDSSKFKGDEGEEELRKCIDISDMYINCALGGEDCNCIVLDESTYKFWSKIIKESKEQAKTSGFIEGMNFVGNGE